MNRWFSDFARRLSTLTGRAWAFVLAATVVAVWAASGPMFGFSDTWQLVINTSTTIVTFLMVFLIQNTQNRDTEAMQIKLDELIRATNGAHNALLDLEELEEAQLLQFLDQYKSLAKASRSKIQRGQQDIDCPEVDKGSAARDEKG